MSLSARFPQPTRLAEPLARPYVTYTRLLPDVPMFAPCVLCGAREQADEMACERCHAPMHWDCYWGYVGSRAEYRRAKRHARDDTKTRGLIVCHGCRS